MGPPPATIEMEDDFDKWLAGRESDGTAGGGNLPPGTLVGDYKIVELIGHGGFADVFRAEGKNGEEVAIKMLHMLDDKSRARFVRESEILSQIRHRNMPRLLSFGSLGNRRMMQSEREKLLHLEEELHRRGFIHRDIKPANILARADGTPVLIDFGLASPISVAKREKEGLSVYGGNKVVVGTVGYSAPEQFSGLPAGREADVHAIGALIYACYGGEMPRCWRHVYLVATTSNPRSRYQSVAELRRSVARRHWRKMLAILLLAIIVGAVTFQCVNWAKGRSMEKRMPRVFHEKGL